MSSLCTSYLQEICKRNEQIIYQLKENIATYESIIHFIGENTEYHYNNMDLVHFYTNLIEKGQQEVNEIQELNKGIIKDIQMHCEHDFSSDLIDIEYDRSQTICYCTICELNK